MSDNLGFRSEWKIPEPRLAASDCPGAVASADGAPGPVASVEPDPPVTGSTGDPPTVSMPAVVGLIDELIEERDGFEELAIKAQIETRRWSKRCAILEAQIKDLETQLEVMTDKANTASAQLAIYERKGW